MTAVGDLCRVYISPLHNGSDAAGKTAVALKTPTVAVRPQRFIYMTHFQPANINRGGISNRPLALLFTRRRLNLVTIQTAGFTMVGWIKVLKS